MKREGSNLRFILIRSFRFLGRFFPLFFYSSNVGAIIRPPSKRVVNFSSRYTVIGRIAINPKSDAGAPMIRTRPAFLRETLLTRETCRTFLRSFFYASGIRLERISEMFRTRFQNVAARALVPCWIYAARAALLRAL